MKPSLFLFLFLQLYCCTAGFSQDIIWADKVLDVSVGSAASARQILGPPDAVKEDNQALAWTPRKQNAQRKEFIHVGFPTAVRARQVAIMESSGPGAVQTITAYFPDGSFDIIYHNKYPRPILAAHRLFTYGFPLTQQKVVAIKIELNTKAANGLNQIDAIAISNQIDEINLEAKTENTPYRPLGTNINTLHDEIQPKVSADGNALYFVRTTHPQNMGDADIWASYREGGKWTRAVNVGSPINNRQPNFIMNVSANNQQLVLRTGTTQAQLNNFFIATKNGRAWASPQRLNLPIPDDADVSDFHLTKDGRTALIAIETPDNGFDLQISFLKNTGWTTLQSLGDVVNTGGDEKTAFLLEDEHTLFFSSDGHDGFGKQDMWKTTRIGDGWTNWSTPVNLGAAINDADHNSHFSFTGNGRKAFFTKKNEAGNLDVFEMNVPEPLLPVASLVKQPKPTTNFQQPETATPPTPIAPTSYLAYDNAGSMMTKGQNSSLQLKLSAINQTLSRLTEQQNTSQASAIKKVALPEDLTENREMDDLRRQFVNNKKQGTAQNQSSTDTQVEAPEEDPELANLKRRFNKYYQKEKQKATDDEYMEMTLGEDGQIYDHDSQMDQHEDDFAALQHQVWNALQASYAPVVTWSIKKQVFTQVENGLLQELSDNMDEAQRGRFRQTAILYYREVKKSLRNAESKKIALKGIRENDITFALRQAYEPEVRKQLYANLRESATAEVRTELHRRFLTREQALVAAKIRTMPATTEREVVAAPAPVASSFQAPKYLATLMQKTGGGFDLKEGQTFLIKGTIFRPNTSLLLPAADQTIEQLLSFLTQYPAIAVEIGIFDDGSGGDLATERARVVYETLLQQGVVGNRMLYRGLPSGRSDEVVGRLKILSIR